MTLSDVLALETERRIRLSPTYVQTFRKRDQANPRNALSAPIPLVTVPDPQPERDAEPKRGPKPRVITHGITGYLHRRCRCEICRAANAEHSKRLRDRRRAEGVCWICGDPVMGKGICCLPCRGREAARNQARRDVRIWARTERKYLTQPSLFQVEA